jgi:hypothetical protein
VAVEDTVAGSTLRNLLAYLDRSSGLSLGVLLADTLQEDRVYRFRAQGLGDKSGNISDSTSPAMEFQGSSLPDTLPPTFTVQGVDDTVRGVPPQRTFEVRFSEPVVQRSARDAVRLLDSLGREAVTRREWASSKDLAVIPRDPLRPAETYRLAVVLDSISDLHGNRRTDSIATVRIRTLDLRSTGFVSGRIQDGGRMGRPGPVAVTASSVGLNPAVVRTAWAEDGTFALRELPEGRYTLSAYVDVDSSGEYSFGRAHPFWPGERYTLLPDTLRVRARWSVENVVVMFP